MLYLAIINLFKVIVILLKFVDKAGKADTSPGIMY